MTGSRIWTASVVSLLDELGATESGLTSSEAARRLLQFGPNSTLRQGRRPLVLQILDRLANPLVLILLFASALSAWTGELASCVIISVIILLSVALDVIQQRRAENAVDALRRSVELKVRVVRDGTRSDFPSSGSCRATSSTCRPAISCRPTAGCSTARDLFVNQSLLTGEPYPVEKHAADLEQAADESPRLNTLFMGTSVISGSATALVCRTGASTEFGSLARTLARSGHPMRSSAACAGSGC